MDVSNPDVNNSSESKESEELKKLDNEIKELAIDENTKPEDTKKKDPEENKEQLGENCAKPLEADEERQAEQKRKMNNLMASFKTLMGLQYMKKDGLPIEVIPNLYIGSIGAALNKKGLKENEISAILCCCDGVKQAFSEEFTYKILPLLDKDSEDIKKYFDEAAAFIHEIIESTKKVLVHCFAGKSRSTTIMMAYLIKYKKMSVKEALAAIKEKRSQVCPNSGFMKQLIEYHKELQSLSQ